MNNMMVIRFCRPIAVAALVISASAQVHAQAVYKWTDRQGQVQYGDSPPAGVKAQRVDEGISVIPSPPLPASTARPGVAPGGPSTNQPADADRPANAPSPAAPSSNDADARRQQLIQRCEEQRGVDCETEADRSLSGPGPGAQSTYPVIVLRHVPNGTFDRHNADRWHPVPSNRGEIRRVKESRRKLPHKTSETIRPSRESEFFRRMPKKDI